MTNIFDTINTSPHIIYETLNQSSNITIWCNKDSTIMMGNKHYINQLGYRNLDHLVGSTYEEQPSEGADLFREWIKQDQLCIRAQKKIHLYSYLKIHNSDTRHLLYGTRTPIYDEYSQSIIGVSAEFQIISDNSAHRNVLFSLANLYSSDSKYLTKTEHGAFTYVLTDTIPDISLTKRQSECLFFLLRGKTAKQIAKILNISPRTVESFIEQLKAKLNCSSKSQLIEKSLEMGFLNLLPLSLSSGLKEMNNFLS